MVWPVKLSLLLCFQSQSPGQAQVIVLDTLTMEWSKPFVEGQAPGIRTRHTAVGVHSDDDHHVYGKLPEGR